MTTVPFDIDCGECGETIGVSSIELPSAALITCIECATGGEDSEAEEDDANNKA